MAAKTVLDFPSLVKKGDYELCKEWLERVPNRMDRVAQVNAASASGSTSLFGCCWDGRTDLLELLLDNGAKVNWKNLKGNTALSMAIEQDQVECVEILLAHGAHADIAEVQQIRKATGKKISPKIDEMILQAQSMQNQAADDDTQQLSALAQAVLANNLDAVVALVTAPPPVITQNNRTQRVEKVQTVTPAVIAARINELDSEGQTVLFAAAQRGYMDIVKVLVDKGADLNFRDRTGKSALHVCIGANQYATVKMLLELGANTTGVDMRQIRFWSMSNISNRIDNLLKKFPPKPLRTSKLKRSPIEGSAIHDAPRADDKSASLTFHC
jgi:ankyrin repeat protein